MATRTVEQGFAKFHSNLTPSGYASGKASSHRASIAGRLEKDFALRRMFYSGSANNGTSIAHQSDVDFFASIPRNNLKANSATSLREIKESLQGRFPNTNIYVDSPAVVLNFGSHSWDTAEVIPADLVDTVANRYVYEIPNGAGGWTRASPNSHTHYVAEHNDRLGKKLKPLIRFVKAWKYFRNVPISSFYLELRITKWMEQESVIVYSIDLKNVFSKLEACGLASIQDPMGISGYVAACNSASLKSDAISKVQTAKTRSENARMAENREDLSDAFKWWDLVFADKFPSYYY